MQLASGIGNGAPTTSSTSSGLPAASSSLSSAGTTTTPMQRSGSGQMQTAGASSSSQGSATNVAGGVQTRDYAALHLEVFELLCTFHRVKRIQTKDTTQCGQLVQDSALSNEQRAELLNRSMYKILNEVEAKIIILPSTTDPVTPDYFDEWSFLTWALLLIINRLEAADPQEIALLDYGGKHFQEKIHAALVDLVNKAHRMQPPPTVQQNDQQFDRFYQAYVTALISLHELYTMTQQQQGIYGEFETHIAQFKKQLVACFVLQREFANCHGFMLWRQLREHQIRKMTHYGYENKSFLDSAVSFYAHMLYNLGVLAARIQGFSYELRSNKMFIGGSGSATAPGSNSRADDLVKPLLKMVYQMADVLLSDSIICLEPSLNPILVTNNLFPMKIVSLCRFSFFRDFSLQIVSEEVAQQIQLEMRHRKTFDPPSPIRKTVTAALLAMKPATGVKRNNARASEGGEGGNTAHKKSDVNSKEWISIPPLFDTEHGGWCATYPHLLCTTRQKETILETRSAMQTGKRPLFYFHVRAELFSFSGGFSTAHTLSLPFTIATRRNQDCQVQRMMSSYTATCFWLYGTNVLDGLLIQWFDGEIEWKHFKLLYSLYFAMNAEVIRTFTDEDFNILQQKMHCPECTDGFADGLPIGMGRRISFKNVLCPHLHFNAAKCDLRFSVWRGMLELLHLFNDQKTETRNLWEVGLLQGFLELKFVHSMLRTLPGSGLVMRLSLVAGACVCFTVKCSNGELLDLEPLDVKRLQAKNLHDYLRDIILAEKVDFVLDSTKEWLHVAEVMKRCQKCASSTDQPPSQPRTREVLSNALHPGPVEKEHKISFTTMRIAVVTCKSNTADNNNEPDDEFGEHTKPEPEGNNHNNNNANFEQQLEELLRNHGKTPEQAIAILARLATAADDGNNNSRKQQLLLQQAPQIYLLDQQQPSSSITHQQQQQSVGMNPPPHAPMPMFSFSVPLSGLNSNNNSSNSNSQMLLPASASFSSSISIPTSSTPIASSSSVPSTPASSATAVAFGSSLEDSYPLSSHQGQQVTHQQQQNSNQQFYFTNASSSTGAGCNNSQSAASAMPTMQMPIVVMPTNNAQATPSFMLFPAAAAANQHHQQLGGATIMTIGSLGTATSNGASAEGCFSTSASNTNNNTANAYIQSAAVHIGGFHSMADLQRFNFQSAASSSSASPSFSIDQQSPHQQHNQQQQHKLLYSTSPIAIVHQQPYQQPQQQQGDGTGTPLPSVNAPIGTGQQQQQQPQEMSSYSSSSSTVVHHPHQQQSQLQHQQQYTH